MTEVNFQLHPHQLEVYQHPARFKVVAAGRRFGKSRLAAVWLLTEGLRNELNGRDLSLTETWYIAPTLEMCRDIMWRLIKYLAPDIIRRTWENELKLELTNGRLIQLKSADKPDRLRGVALSAVAFDEYAQQRAEVWEEIIQPTLADVRGKALWIGTPVVDADSHFYRLWLDAADQGDDWAAWQFVTLENPFIPAEEIERARRTMTTAAFRREFEASFESVGGEVLDSALLIEQDEPPADGEIYVSVDLSGFADTSSHTLAQLRSLDETAIAVVQVGTSGWYVHDIIHGRWDVRRTSVEILRAVQKWRPVRVGIERGSLQRAVMGYLPDQARRLGIGVPIVDVGVGPRKGKAQRIGWALQGRMEQGRIKFAPGSYMRALRNQVHGFPASRRDDMIDALALIDQIATTAYGRHAAIEETWQPLDSAVGY